LSIRATRRIIAGLVLPFVVAGCGILGGTNLPTHRDWGGASPATPQAGRLTLVGDCVSLVDDQGAGNWLVVWPPGARRDGFEIVGSNGSHLADIGDEVSLEGGEYDAVSVVSQLTQPIDVACQTDRYWLVADVTVDTRPSVSP
jgi:hypothetical protein